MSKEEKKAWLSRYLSRCHEIEQDCRAIRRWKQLAEGVTPQLGRSARGSGEKQGSRMERAVCEMADLQKQLPGKVDGLPDVREEIATAIAALPDERQRLVLQYRYFHGLSFAALGKRVGYCEYYVSVLHKNALELLLV